MPNYSNVYLVAKILFYFVARHPRYSAELQSPHNNHGELWDQCDGVTIPTPAALPTCIVAILTRALKRGLNIFSIFYDIWRKPLFGAGRKIESEVQSNNKLMF